MNSKKVRQLPIHLGLGLLLLLGQNCSDVKFSKITPSSCEDRLFDGCIGGLGDENFRIDFEDRDASFSQPNATQYSQPIDILIVTDTSGSMDQERNAVANGIRDFIDDRFTDFRVAVTLAHGQSQWSGAPYRSNGAQDYILSSENYDTSNPSSLEALQADLRSKMDDVASERASDGGEVGLYSLYRALEPSKFAFFQSVGFFRPNAALAIVFVADENDICAHGHLPPGIPQVPDGEGIEPGAYENFCINNIGQRFISPASVLAGVKAMKGNQPVIMGGVLYINRNITPAGTENETGYGYIEMIGRNIGVPENQVHQTDQIKDFAVELAPEFQGENIPNKIRDGLAFIGQAAGEELRLRTSFTINLAENERYVPNSAQVFVDNVPVPSTAITSDEGTYVDVFIDRSQAGGANSSIVIQYQVGVRTDLDDSVSGKLASNE